MKSKYIEGLVSEPHYKNFETLWSAQFEIPNTFAGTLYIEAITASELCRAKGQRIPFIISKAGKKIPYSKQGLALI